MRSVRRAGIGRRAPTAFALILGILVACVPGPAAPVSTTPEVDDAAPVVTPTPCVLAPIAVPTRPAETPGYVELDPTTGLHMTGTPTEVDLASYRLEVTGKVEVPLSLTYDQLRCMPRIERRATLVCPGFFEDQATWAGASLDHVLGLAQVQDDATQLRLVGADGYYTLVRLVDLVPDDDFLAYEWEGEPLPILHGFPVRLVFPALNGSKWVKWLLEIEVY
ncbi:MAG: molybdopterin-dependent oxidoreductase [Anaerolineae bacterium]|nr:molybdopterin-dependent oxidoreductase [Anaerolineae bacterium]